MSDDSQDAKDVNRSQFGANAQNYADSAIHAKGASLARMVELTHPQLDWLTLDIATAAGHTAFAFAPFVEQVIASDLTPEMVELAAARADELGHDNVSAQLADAEDLPFEDEKFDLVSCRIAPHHFPRPDLFINEVARVLKPGGTFVLVDNVVPDDAEVALFCNDWERQRDPSHVCCLSMNEWTNLLTSSGMQIEASETAPKRMSFGFWVNNTNVPEDLRPTLLAELHDATPAVRDYLRPVGSTQDDTAFFLTEGLLVASK